MSESSTALRRPPGPADPVQIGVDPETLELFTAARDRFGDMIAFTQRNGRPAYFINDAFELRRILARRHARYRKGPGFERVKMLLGNGLIVSDGDTWRRSRRMIQPAFSRQNVHRLLAAMVECCDRRAVKWASAAERKAALNITAETSEFALELILVSIFGDDYESRILSQDENPFEFLANDSTRDLGVVMKARNLREFLLELVAARRESGNPDSYDFLSMYMHATDKEGSSFSDKELLDELITLIVAGFETSANTLNWVWYLLAGRPDVEAAVIEEARKCIPTVSAVNAESLADMQYTMQVLEETLRLYPPVWLFSRRSIADDVLEDFDIPAGTDIYLSPFILHRTEKYWPDPERFDPDRFAPGRLTKNERPYFPFSLGPRRCLGEYFSFLEMKVHLGLLLPRFRMMRVDDSVPGLELAVNLRSDSNIVLQPQVRAA